MSLAVWSCMQNYKLSLGWVQSTDPLSLGGFNPSGLLDQGISIAFSLMEAIVILLVGWGLARIVRSLVVGALNRTTLDNQLAALLTGGRSEKMPVEETLGAFTFGSIMFFVSIEAMQALGLTMVTEPLNQLLGRMVDFVPQLFAAAVLALLAWVLASLARMLILNLLSSFELDRHLGEAMTDADAERAPRGQGTPLSQTLGDAAYYLVFLFFLPQMLDALRMQGLRPVQEMVGRILGIIPNLMGVAIMLAVFYFVAKIVQRLMVQLLTSVGFDRVPEMLGLGGVEGPRASVASGWVVFASLMSMGVVQAADTLGLTLISEVTRGLMTGLLQAFLACGILAVGLYLGNLVQAAIVDWEQGRGRKESPLAGAARTAILCLTVAMALGQTGLAPEIVHMTFGAFVFGAAIAGGLAFGLGGRESAARWLESRRTGGDVSPDRV